MQENYYALFKVKTHHYGNHIRKDTFSSEGANEGDVTINCGPLLLALAAAAIGLVVLSNTIAGVVSLVEVASLKV
jgi:hypothetical protein